VHLTLRAVRGLPSLRARRAYEGLVIALGRSCGPRFRVIYFSVQTDHLHMIVEGASSRALARGAQGLAVRCARALNRAWARHGRVWSHRYHARALRTPTEVRSAIAYVLLNFRKHLRGAPGVDPRSSGRWFEGWSHHTTPGQLGAIAPPRTWLAAVGWRSAGGDIDVRQGPGRS
jgi:REP-associated tyrosine transposase